ncbi:MAG TPA: CBM35 domain-containing protein [Actinoplanes sp.]|nr:CBM35 domain-containing protein [Actinoplanes sp.]
MLTAASRATRTLSPIIIAAVIGLTATACAPAGTRPAASPAAAAVAPVLGWSSASLQSTRDEQLNPKGRFSWLNEKNVLAQAGALAGKLKKYGYQYVNLDAGWWMTYGWKPRYDGNARQIADPERFPHGMAALADRIHAQGLRAGLYLPVGLEKPAYGDGTIPIAGAPGCTTADIVFADRRTTNGWDSSYQLDFGNPCAARYVASQAALIASWGIDFLKLDGVGPGSGKGGGQYDNTADVKAWRTAIDATGRPIHLDLAWSLDAGRIGDWQAAADSWRIDTDVECYCRTLTTWDNSVNDRFADAPAWTPFAGAQGYNNLDSLPIGNGRRSGLTDDERRSAATLWAISASPLVVGDDLTTLDKLGTSLLTNREVIAVDQQGVPARPLSPAGDRQVWGMRNTDGSYTVALFNLGDRPADVAAHWSSLGFTGAATLRDLWAQRDKGTVRDSISVRVPAHGASLFRVVPAGPAAEFTAHEAEAPANTLTAPAVTTGCDACSGGQKVGNLYGGGALTVNDVQAPVAGTYQVNVTYTTGDQRGIDVSANGGPATHIDFPVSGGWNTPATITVPVTLRAGGNSIRFDSGNSYSPDLDRIDVPNEGAAR